MSRPAAKKEDIEEAAIRLFAGRGLARTSVRDIAQAAGVTEGALYRHYSGKNDLAWKLFSREVERFTAAFEGALFDEARPFEERLQGAVRFVYEYYRDHPRRFAFILLTQHGFPEEKLLDERTNPNDMAIRFVKRLMADGSIPDGDPALTAALLMGAILQPVVMHRYGRVRRHPIKVSGEVARACIGMLKGNGVQGHGE